MQCQKCYFKTNDRDSLEFHMKSEHSFKCQCKEVFTTDEELQKHIMEFHTHQCIHCENMFESKILLKNHTLATHDLNCIHCNKVFTSNILLEAHLEQNHLYFKCDCCPYVTSTMDKLMEHDTMNHQGCIECEDEFSWPEPGHSCYYTFNNIRPPVSTK